jgi:hypothetical protein
MPAVRVYVPLGRAGLLALAADRVLEPMAGQPLVAYAVTPGLEAAHPGEGVEELEYLAFCDAAAAARALRESPTDRRVVVSADADADWLSDHDGGTAAVALATAVPLARIASLHVDDEGALAAGDDSPDELLWYDATELGDVRSFFA